MIRKRLVPLAVLGLLILAVPEPAFAQCTDRCVDIKDKDGNDVGFGCVDGGPFTNCKATTERCSLDGCIAQVIISAGRRGARHPAAVRIRCARARVRERSGGRVRTSRSHVHR